MTIYLGLDGGGTGCRAAAQRPDGTYTDVMVGGPANIFSGGEAALRNIYETACQAVRASAPSIAIETLKPQVVAVLGLAGAVEVNAGERIKQMLGFGAVHVVGDVEAALNGAFQSQNGVMSAIGTGTVHASKLNGAMKRVGGYGFLLGDEGGGAWMGRALLSRALHVRDGLIESSDLTREIWREMGDLATMLTFARMAAPAEFAAFAPRIIAAGEAGDTVATTIISDAALWVHQSIDSLQTQDVPMPVAFTGGLGPFFAKRLADRWPIKKPIGSALDGALWMARHLI
ncbi:BadF/BadG/BcrA/BcrD ATPase family protein [Saccharospirillum sp.]|uniref:BadF/BadG/BcrA/BcrD ATPase family protein n=1 Tax=Saccharospirillum sp. TaxID=2033801 RepID=UPI0034A03239